MNRVLITAVCAAMAFPTLSTADDHDHGTRPPSYQQGGGQHNGYNGNRNDNDGAHRDNRGGDHQYYAGGRYPYYGHNERHYVYGYRPYYYGNPYPYYNGHSHHDGNDDAAWAIGGLVLGAILGSAVAQSQQPRPQPNATTVVQPPQKYCDHIEYDAAGNPYVERRCRL
jgi:hypothetical protein